MTDFSFNISSIMQSYMLVFPIIKEKFLICSNRTRDKELNQENKDSSIMQKWRILQNCLVAIKSSGLFQNLIILALSAHFLLFMNADWCNKSNSHCHNYVFWALDNPFCELPVIVWSYKINADGLTREKRVTGQNCDVKMHIYEYICERAMCQLYSRTDLTLMECYSILGHQSGISCSLLIQLRSATRIQP